MSTSPFLALAVFALASVARAGQDPPLATVEVATGFQGPIFATAPPNDFARLFVAEQGQAGTARIKIVELATGTVRATPFLTLTGVDAHDERGLLGLAFHPDYAVNGYFYVYLSNAPTSNVIRRYQVSSDANVADPSSAQTVILMSDPYDNHNGGWIAFGPDGYFYVATGDGGSQNDPLGHSQSIGTLLGKILRIDVDADGFPGDSTKNYAIPASNPFAGLNGLDEIWHYGVRNPWRCSFDQATGDLYIGDVGQNNEEEISFQSASSAGGLDYGWRCMEGNSCTGLSGCTCNSAALTLPIHSYLHNLGCSVIGGYVYRGTDLCGLEGTYFFGDHCSGRLWSFRQVGGAVTNLVERTAELDPPGPASTLQHLSSFGEDARGELYMMSTTLGALYKIVAAAPTDCNANGIEDACDIVAGTSTDADGDGVPDECNGGPEFCFGDGSVVPCPCGNNGAPQRGCLNSVTTAGAALHAAGSAHLSADTFSMTAEGMTDKLCVFMQGDLELAPTAFGDGLRCAGGNLKRLYIENAAGGAATAPGASDPSVSARSASLGDVIPAGALRFYQTYYREPDSSFCPPPAGDRWNATSGLRVAWMP